MVKVNNLKPTLASAQQDMIQLHSQNDHLVGAQKNHNWTSKINT